MLHRNGYLVLVIVFLACFVPPILAQDPLSEIHSSDASPRIFGPAPDGHGRGFRLPEYAADVRPGKLGVRPAPGMEKAAEDPAFDWESLGKCPPVRNQGGTGTCWIHASVGQLESRVAIREGLTTTSFEYSEQDIGNFYPLGNWTAGGNGHLVATYLSKFGTVNESDEPWVVPANSSSHGEWDPTNPYVTSIRNWHFLGDLTTDNTAIKNALTHGPVTTSMCTDACFDWDYENWPTRVVPATVQVLFPKTQNDHDVVVVGWDDNMPHAEGGAFGAWKVRNSWGSSWGYGGYCWIGYGAAGIGYGTSYFPTATEEVYEDRNPNMTVLSYDNGWNGSALGWVSWSSAQMLNVYTIPALPPDTNYLYAIDICAAYPNA
ncbi:C1 family peptidase [Candidatus Sumerlaeota bacterium]|nr:C1 family peptidase [Candidatus Sumerlaeota bacterium]